MSESVKNLKEKLDNLLDDGAHNSLSDNSAVVDHLLEPAAPIVANDAVLPVENDIFNEKSNILELETEKNEVDFKAHRQKTPVTVPAIKITSMEREIQALQLTKRNGLRNSEKDAYILAHSFGFQSHKRSNIHFIDDGIILSSIGNLMVFYNFKTNEQRYVEGIREASIGAIAVHPSGKYIAVGEVCRTQPNIYLYEYPSMDLYKILKGGASRGYADLTFNTSGTKIASVATEPDYTLTVWNWESSSILLRSKAFSQDVFRVRFSADNDGILTTSGMGHIKFWRMATTFTGLKLQGYLGKFGASELSDIASFLQLPDGKVLSTTETGNLLLWDGGMIKCEICVKGGIPCHQGKVEVILLVEDEIITAGEDGYVRVWDLETIDNADVITAEGSGSSVATPRVFEMLPKDQMLISKEVKIKCLIKDPYSLDYFIQDQNGQLLKYDSNKRTSDRYLSFHSGPVNGLCASAVSDSITTLGSDGSLKCYNYTTKKVSTTMQFIQPGTCLIPLPILLDALGTTVVAGFEDGVIRFVSISVKGGLLHYAIKPSRAAIVSMAVSDDGTNLAVSSADKTIFFFALHKINGAGNVAFTKTNVSVTPVGFIKMKEVAKTLSFGAVSEHRVPAAKNAILCHRLLITTLFKYIFDVIIPTDLKFDTSSTFEIPEGAYRIQEWKPDIPVCVEEAKEVALTKSRQNLLGKDEKRNLTSKEATPKQSNQNLSQAGTPGSANKLDIVGKDSASSKLLFGGDDLKAASVKHRLNLTVDSKYSIAIYVSEDFFIAAVINENDQTSSVIRLFKKNLAGFSLILGLVDGEATTLAYDHLKNQLSVGTINGIVSIFRLSLENLPINLQERIPKELIKHESQAEYVSRFESSINNILFEMEKADPNFDIENPSPGLLIDGQIWSGHLHDAAHGKITGVSCSFDNSYLISAGTDGGIFVWKSKYVTSSEVQIDEAAIIEQLESANMAVDILESSAYSIQDETLQSEKDKELGKAEKKKEEVKAKILSLRKQYQAVLEENYKASDTWQLSKSELVVDPFLAEDIKKDLETKVEETRKELTWQSEKDLIGANKLITKFLHPLQTERIELHAFKNSSSVKSFRCLKFETPLELLDSFSLKNLASNGDKAEKDRVSSQNLSDQVASKKNAQKSDKFQATIKKLEARRLFKEERAALWKQLLEERPDETYQDPNDLAAIQQAKTNMGDYKLKCAVNYVVPENERETSSSKKRHIQLANEGIKSLKKEFNEKFFKLRANKVNIIEFAKISMSDISKLDVEIQRLGIDESPETRSFSFNHSLEPDLFPEHRYLVSAKEISELKEEEQKAVSSVSKKGIDNGRGFSNNRQELLQLQSKAGDNEIVSTRDKISQILEPECSDAEKAHIIFQKKILIDSINDRISKFDDSVKHLYNESIALSADLKYAQIKLQVLYKEWLILKEYDDTDKLLIDKVEMWREEKRGIEERIEKYKQKLNEKRSEIEQIITREREIHEEYRSAVGEDKNEEYLSKVFKRKLRKDNADDCSTDEFQERMPTGIDEELWQRILELRDSRVAQEDLLIQIKQEIDQLKSEKNLVQEQFTEIESNLSLAEEELSIFFTSKNQKLNDLEIAVPLKYSQILHLQNSKPPSDFTDCVVFTNNGISALKSRITEISQEKTAIKRSHHALRKSHITLTNSKIQKAAYVAEMTAKAEDVQMLKFGQLVDLEKLEKLGVNRQAEELKERLKIEEIERMREIAARDAVIRQEKLLNYKVLEENTACLELLVDLTTRSQSLTRSLDQAQSNLASSDLSGPTAKEMYEKQKLQALIAKQSTEIKHLKEEINNLIQKPSAKLIYRQKVEMDPIFKTAPSSDFLALDATAFPDMALE